MDRSQHLKEIAQESAASQDWFELWQLLCLLDQDPPKRILEIGVHRGGMLESLLRAFNGAHLVGVDTDFSFLEFRSFEQVDGNSMDPVVRNEAIELAGDYGGVDFVFIDGDHRRTAVLSDYEFYAPAVRSGGIVAFHDIARYPGQYEGVEVQAAWAEIRKKHANMEIWNGSAGVNGPGIGVLFV